MASRPRSEDFPNEAAEPLYRDSSEQAEKPSQYEQNDETLALQASIRILRRWLLAVSLLLAIACAYTLFSFGGVVSDHKTTKRLSFAPDIPEKFVKFERTLFASGSTPEADEAWGNDLSPPGDGFVLIPNPKDYSLPPGQTTREGEGEIYDISVFHQLHCLNHVRTFLFTLKAGMDYNNTVETYDSLLKHQEDHVYHCFDYIRQALMCNADLTVEWPKTEANGERVAVDGWGVQHQCKNWDSVLEFMGKYRIPNAWGGHD
ncbi:hypothetical protein WHR41_05290 [Cladosporium halotolerans]|uniref:Oxidase ustYa n=1 Tax=Cladosporium halotolerans TaxID=1052096 RepID=A0AB34KT76_9PEZI